jgi:hypothetical protein
MKSECETPTPDTRTYKWASLHLDSKVQSKDWDHDEVFFFCPPLFLFRNMITVGIEENGPLNVAPVVADGLMSSC